MNPYFISPILTFVGALISIAVLWGVLRATVSMLKERVEKLDETIDKHEGNLLSFREEFTSFREEARVWFAGQEAGKMYASAPQRKKSARR